MVNRISHMFCIHFHFLKVLLSYASPFVPHFLAYLILLILDLSTVCLLDSPISRFIHHSPISRFIHYLLGSLSYF